MSASTHTKVLRVAASAEGYRREGLKFGRAVVDIPESILTSNQIHRLKRDPMLKCHELLVSTEPAVSDEEFSALREKAAVADAFLAKLPPGFPSDQCPSEYVTLLLDHIHELELAKATAQATIGATATKRHGRQ
ncbi:hypothetical protein [Burkholderia pyrrocinia]|uniref:hypothetical protein n=1 Tax=Burkholderia pyrrocinia TaxID=60550 RepID=UPI00158B727A|nr:hypothetical protein [Burkholderia pyrrocinia]